MNDDHSIITIRRDACATIMDSIQRTIIDKGASRATRKTTFSALLALIDVGLIVGDTSTSPARDQTRATQEQVSPRQLLAG